MDKRFAVTAAAVLAVALASAFLAAPRLRKEEPESLPLSEEASGIQRAAPVTAPEQASLEEHAYLIREYEGRVAVFRSEEPDVPEIVYDTLVRYLPDTDREELERGVPVRDYSELVSRVEDYIS